MTQVESPTASPTSDTHTPEAHSPESIAPQIEAVLVAAGRVVSTASLAAAIAETPVPNANVEQAIDLLNKQYQSTARAFRIERVAGGHRVMTLTEHAEVIDRWRGSRNSAGLSRVALETLAIVAYKQPITRASLEAVRGAACGDVLRNLIDKRLVTTVGRAEELGRPLLYGTTRAFLDAFGLPSLKDLPSVKELTPTLEEPQTQPHKPDPVSHTQHHNTPAEQPDEQPATDPS